MISMIGNVLWFLLGGVFMGLGWWFFGVLALISVVGIPWAKACFVIGAFAFFPFGKTPVNRSDIQGYHDIGTGPFGIIGNVIWFVFAGIWLAIGHILSAAALAVTIIGIPFAWQHVKLAGIALLPIGMTVIED